MLGLLVLSSFLSFVASQQGCCAPDKWEGFATELTSQEQLTGVLTDKISFSYDYNKKMVAETVYKTLDGERVAESYLFDFGNHKGYQFYKEKQTCLTFILVKSFRRFCINDGTYSPGNAYIGVGPKRFLTRTFYTRPSGEKYNITATVTWEDPKCVPIRDLSFGTKNKIRFVNSVIFTDISLGIKDPSIFSPPDYCVKTFDVPHQETTGRFLTDHMHSKFME